MFVLTDDTIETAIDSAAGFIIASVSTETGRPLAEVAKLFYASEMYASLSNKNTGYYWDSIPEMIEKFISEMPSINK